MSYILDALTKSQQQRREGGVPTLSTPQLALDSAKGARARYANGALIVLAAVAVLFAVQMLIRQNDGVNVPPQTAADAPSGGAPTAPVLAPSPERSPAPATPATAAPPAAPAANTPSASPRVPAKRQATQASEASPPQPSQPLKLAGQRDSTLTDAPIASPPRPAAPTDKPLESTASTAPPPMSSEESAIRRIEERLFPGAERAVHPDTARLAEELLEMAARSASAPSEVVPDKLPRSEVASPPASAQAAATFAPASPDRETATAAAPAEMMPTAPAAPAGGDVLPSVRALPSDMQASLGRLTINAHVYNEIPSGRMVIINMKRYQEGESLREGPRVERITVTGAILSYQSHRFHLNVR